MAPAHPHATGVAVYPALFLKEKVILTAGRNSFYEINHREAAIFSKNKPGYTATPVACGWAGTIFEVTRPFGQEQCSQ